MPETLEALTREASIACYARSGEHIGQGGQGIVYRYIHQPTGNVYAAKVLRYENGATKRNRDIIREQGFAPQFDHVIICQYSL